MNQRNPIVIVYYAAFDDVLQASVQQIGTGLQQIVRCSLQINSGNHTLRKFLGYTAVSQVVGLHLLLTHDKLLPKILHLLIGFGHFAFQCPALLGMGQQCIVVLQFGSMFGHPSAQSRKDGNRHRHTDIMPSVIAQLGRVFGIVRSCIQVDKIVGAETSRQTDRGKITPFRTRIIQFVVAAVHLFGTYLRIVLQCITQNLFECFGDEDSFKTDVGFDLQRVSLRVVHHLAQFD